MCCLRGKYSKSKIVETCEKKYMQIVQIVLETIYR